MHSAVALTTMWTWDSSPSPASLPDTIRLSPLRVAVTVSSTKCGLPANATGTASANELSASTITIGTRCIRSPLRRVRAASPINVLLGHSKRAADTRRKMSHDEALRDGSFHDLRLRAFELRWD